MVEMYTPVGHVSGTQISRIEATRRLPWLYVICSIGSKIIYIGETFEEGGLLGRLSKHFGPYSFSTLKQRAETVANIRHLRSPFLVLGARVPFGDEDVPVDGAAKYVRLSYEAIFHQIMGLEFIPENPSWTIVSTPQPSSQPITEYVEVSCKSIFDCYVNAFGFLEPLSEAVPYQVVLLDRRQAEELPSDDDLGQLIESAEVVVYRWLLQKLKQEFGADWWDSGVPEPIRVQCVTRREKETTSQTMPPEAYMTLIDFRDIMRKNWSMCSSLCASLSGEAGKDKATNWLVELNEARKLWAHPIKRIFKPFEPADILRVKILCGRITKTFVVI